MRVSFSVIPLLLPIDPPTQAVLAEGGCEEVTRCRKWRAVARKVSSQTTATYTTVVSFIWAVMEYPGYAGTAV